MTQVFPPAVLAQHIAIIGKTGAGKTSTGKLLVEQVVAGDARVCILDPIKSDWWGLTSSADGKRPGLPFHILGGPHGHVPLHAGAGKAIGELVGKGALPLSIIDMADFEAGGAQRFFVDFVPALMRNMRGVLYLILEEAHEFAPKERAGFGHENMAIHYAKKLATGTRSMGIRMIVLTHSVQQLHNRVLDACDTLIAQRLTTPASQKPVLDWLKANVSDKGKQKEIAESLSSLKTGTGWLCAGELAKFERVAFPRISTYDNSATPTADSKQHQVTQAPVEVSVLRQLIGAAVEEAEANDPKLLKRRIAELERQVAAKPVAAVPATKGQEDLIYKSGYDTGRQHGYEGGVQAVHAPVLRGLKVLREDLLAAIRQVTAQASGSLADQVAGLFAKIEMPVGPAYKPANAPPPRPPPFRPAPTPDKVAVPRRAPPPAPRGNGSGHVHLPPGERAVLEACIQYPDGLDRSQLTVLTGYKRSSRDAYIFRLREKGFVETVADRVIATQAGIAAIPDAAPLPTGEELRDFWRARLPEGERKVLDELCRVYPDAMERAELDDRTGYKRSSRDAYLSRLAAKELVTEPVRGQVRASEVLFA